MRTRMLAVMMLLTMALAAAPAVGQRTSQRSTAANSSNDEVKSIDEDLRLERLFPERSFWGPSASSMSFSHDGRYGAYLYRPYIERRHGSDLWLYDTETGEATRITKVSVMSEFTRNARNVRDDRTEKEKRRRQQSRRSGGDDRRERSGDDDAAHADDGVSGRWTGTFDTSNGNGGFVLEDNTIILNLTLDDDGAVTGTVTAGKATNEITEGTFDADESKITLTTRHGDSGMSSNMTGTISNGSMTGSLTLGLLGITLQFTAEHAGAAREVGDDETTDTQEKEEIDFGDIVDERDAQDRRSPRYSGVSSYVWAPYANEMIFLASGDLYRLVPESGEITRLTRTRESARNVQYLPDGSGFTYLRGSALIKVNFDSGLIQQIDPQLPSGESMSSYRISPDGSRVAFLARRGPGWSAGGRGVTIVNYRGRFAEARQFSRHMPDDPFPELHTTVYLYDINDHLREKGTLKRVFAHRHFGPRDAVSLPDWSLDSSRAAFAVYDQGTDLVTVYESRIVEEPQDVPADTNNDNDANENANRDSNDDQDDDQRDDGDEEEGDDEREESEPSIEIQDARPVYRFFHNGGPNTPNMIQPRYLPDNRHLTFIAEISGFRHLHVLDPLYERQEQLTRGLFEVYPVRQTEDRATMFVTATKDDPTQEHVFSVDLTNGDMKQLSVGQGVYSSVGVSHDGKHVLANHVDFGSPTELNAIQVDAEDPKKQLTDSHPAEAHALSQPEPEYFTFENRHGHTIHGHMFKPDDWSADDQRPLLIYVYGGPLGRRNMTARGSFAADSYYFAYYMAKKHGYVTCTVDPRGVSGYGGLFERSNFERAGQAQVEDLVDAAEWFVANQGVDENRVGIHGWSFGGFQTQMCLYTAPDVFACGIAGAGPTEWMNYNSWYTTGTIGDKEGLSEDGDAPRYSLLPLAKNLKAKLLLVHGMEDSNVLYQDTVRVYRELLKAGKETLVELFLDPTGGHGLGGDVQRVNRYRKYEEFLLRCLGSGEPIAATAEGSDDTEEGEAQES